jgi:hypothetical protein
MQGYYRHRTTRGAFSIQKTCSGEWQAQFDGETLGTFPDPQIALDALVAGRTDRPTSGIDPTVLSLPPHLSGWTVVRVG